MKRAYTETGFIAAFASESWVSASLEVISDINCKTFF